jgi:transposase-like protein
VSIRSPRTLETQVPLCRAYLAAFCVSHHLRIVNSDGAVHWAFGCLTNGQFDRLGVWFSGDQVSQPVVARLDNLLERGVERVHLVVCQPHAAQQSLVAWMGLGAHALPSVVSVVHQSLAQVGPRARTAVAHELRILALSDSLPAAEAALAKLIEGPLGARYPALMTHWRDELPRLAPLFALPSNLRRLLLLGDSAVQALRRSLERSIRRRGSFSSWEAAATFFDQALARAVSSFEVDGLDRVPAAAEPPAKGMTTVASAVVHA